MSSEISWNPSRELKAIQPRLHRSLSGALARIGDDESFACTLDAGCRCSRDRQGGPGRKSIEIGSQRR